MRFKSKKNPIAKKHYLLVLAITLLSSSFFSPFTFAQEEVDTLPFALVEQKPSFNGGDANEFSKWINSKIVYPETAKANNTQGRVTLEFTVGADGSVKDVRVLRGIDPDLDKEAVRVVSSSPKWVPGRHKGVPVNVSFNYPVVFSLPKDSNSSSSSSSQSSSQQTRTSIETTNDAPNSLSAFGTTLYKMSESEISSVLAGSYYVHRPPKDGWYDPDDGTLGMIINSSGFNLVHEFAQTIYPATGSGNINGKVTESVRYYNGTWYKGTLGGVRSYVLVGYKQSIKLMNFANGNWIGNSEEIIPTKSTSASVIQYENGVWYYLNNTRHRFPFMKK